MLSAFCTVFISGPHNDESVKSNGPLETQLKEHTIPVKKARRRVRFRLNDRHEDVNGAEQQNSARRYNMKSVHTCLFPLH